MNRKACQEFAPSRWAAWINSLSTLAKPNAAAVMKYGAEMNTCAKITAVPVNARLSPSYFKKSTNCTLTPKGK